MTEEQREAVFALLRDKKTSNEIAEIVGVTRNAVCGLRHRYNQIHAEKIGRVGQSYKRKTKKQVAEQKDQFAKKVRLVTFNGVKVVSPGSKRIHRLKDNECKYAVTSHNEPATAHRFCGKPQRAKSSYCEEHHKICHETENERKQKRKSAAAEGKVWIPTRFVNAY